MNYIAKSSIAVLVISVMLFSSVAKPCEPLENTAEVFYFGFDIDRITGIVEEEIKNHGCSYTIPQQRFLELLSPITYENGQYDKFNVRAVITLLSGSKYFVDYDGRVKNENATYAIDKEAFQANLSLLKPGKCK